VTNPATGADAAATGILDVHRYTFFNDTNHGASATPGVGNTPRNPSLTIGENLPLGFTQFPYFLAYVADGVRLVPNIASATTGSGGSASMDTVTFFNVTLVYKVKSSVAGANTIDEPTLIAAPGAVVYSLFQLDNTFGYTAAPMAYSSATTQLTIHTRDFLVPLPGNGVGQTTQH